MVAIPPSIPATGTDKVVLVEGFQVALVPSPQASDLTALTVFVPGLPGAPGQAGQNGAAGPKGDDGATGPAGQSAPQPLTFSLSSVSSYNAPHGFSFVPRVTLTDPTGAEVETDVTHLPGQVHLSFPAPFTGSLTLA